MQRSNRYIVIFRPRPGVRKRYYGPFVSQSRAVDFSLKFKPAEGGMITVMPLITAV